MEQQKFEVPINETKKMWFQQKILKWGKENLRVFPWRSTDDPYKIFVAEFLLQQTDAPRVIPVYEQILQRYPNLKTLSEASLSEVKAILRPLGFHYRASRLIGAARLITENPAYKGIIPDDEKMLLRLPGVGRYIARSVCANAFNQPVAVLDTNISRIIQRFFGLKSHAVRARDDTFFWQVAQWLIPDAHVSLWNLALIDFGAMVCTFRNPRCFECPLRQQCEYGNSLTKA